jgi:hypothetical protein
VLTRDFALYHDVVRLLRERGLAFQSLAFDELPSPQVAVVITSWRDTVLGGLPERVPVVAVPVGDGGEEDVEAGVAAALRVIEGHEEFKELVVGIDPGRRPGLAVLGDGRLVHWAHAVSEQQVVALALKALKQFDARRVAVRVGDGSPKERTEILRRLARASSEEGFLVEVVDETGTTPAQGQSGGLPLDVAAAVRIARSRGEPAFPVARHEPTEREVVHVQKESRTASGGRFTISRASARRVARGDWSMEEALRREDPESRTRGSRPGSR